jgi:hypothetical protein
MQKRWRKTKKSLLQLQYKMAECNAMLSIEITAMLLSVVRLNVVAPMKV